MKYPLVFLILSFMFSYGLVEAKHDTVSRVVSTKSGPVRGVQVETASGKVYYQFKGIPFAKPPVGDLRFKPSEPVEPWSTILDAREDGQPCIQIPVLTEKGTIGSEDCLWLSIFSQNLPAANEGSPGSAKPVMVWIHGGRFMVGSARTDFYSPEFIMDYSDIVVVSIQYRLGALGFLSTEDEYAPGNYGLFDQVLALKWVKDNILAFGGDPSRITIVGQSAGAASVHSHMFSPLSKGLFTGAVALSGTANMAWASRFSAKRMALRQADLVNCPSNATSKELVDCLRSVDVETLVLSQQEMHVYYQRTPAKLPVTLYYPRVDSEADEPFLPRDPSISLRSGLIENPVPLLIGLTKSEGAWYTAQLFGAHSEERLRVLNSDLYNVIRHIPADDFFSTETVKEAIEFYLGNAQVVDKDLHRMNMTNLITDMGFVFEALMAAHWHAKAALSPVYLYRFDYEGQFSYTLLFDPDGHYGGPAHADDVRYLLRMKFTPMDTEEDLKMIENYTKMIVSFVTSHQPEPSWPQISTKGSQYFVINGHEGHLGHVEQGLPFPEDRMRVAKDLYGTEEDFFSDYNVHVRGKEEL